MQAIQPGFRRFRKVHVFLAVYAGSDPAMKRMRWQEAFKELPPLDSAPRREAEGQGCLPFSVKGNPWKFVKGFRFLSFPPGKPGRKFKKRSPDKLPAPANAVVLVPDRKAYKA